MSSLTHISCSTVETSINLLFSTIAEIRLVKVTCFVRFFDYKSNCGI